VGAAQYLGDLEIVGERTGATVDDVELRDLVRSRKGPVHTPKAIHVVDALPLTPVGKPDKKALRRRHWPESGRAVH